MRERTRIIARRVWRYLVSTAVMVAVATAAGGVPAVSTDGTSTSPGALGDTTVGTSAPTLPQVDPPAIVAPSDRPPPVAPAPPATDTSPVVATPVPPMVASTPVGLRIPSIGVDTELHDLGLQADGSLEVPASGFPAGWYTGAPTPGELGPAIIAGHVDWGGQPGVFFDLRELTPGDEIAVTRQDGSTAHFRVTRTERFDKDDFPTRAVYGDLDHAGLRLITCGGEFDRRARSYHDNLVVFAELR